MDGWALNILFLFLQQCLVTSEYVKLLFHDY